MVDRFTVGKVFLFVEVFMKTKYRIDSVKVQARAAELGLSLQAAAFHSGVSQDTLRRVYSGQGLSFTERSTLGLSKALKMKVSDFAQRA